MRVKSLSDGIVSLPCNQPQELLASLLVVGIEECTKVAPQLLAGSEQLVAAVKANPTLFVACGYRPVSRDVHPGEVVEIDEKALLPTARAQLAAMTRKGGSLQVVK